MFVRWKRRERLSVKAWKQREDRSPGWWKKRRLGTGKFLLSAVLVRAERRDGKPRQQVVAYLGSIDEANSGQLAPREHFWRAVDDRLATLDLDPTQRQLVEAALAKRVARLTAAEAEELAAQRTQARADLVKAILRCGGDPSGLLDLFKSPL
jgi:hypothetical protein